MELLNMHPLIVIVLTPIAALLAGLFFMGVTRKFTARIHWRYGPPITQPLIDIMRMFSQRPVSHGTMFHGGVILSLAGALAVLLFIPFGNIPPLSGSGGLLVILYLLLVAPLGLALSSGEGANPNASIGISRKLMLSLGYEVPLLLILLTLMTRYGTLSIYDIVHAQQETQWALVTVPLFISGIAYILILPAVLGIRPFEVVQAAQEISSGPLVEYSGPYLGLVHLEHGLTLVINIALFVNLFMGGAQNILLFFVKMIIILLAGLSINAVFPRLRTDQAVSWLWRWPALLALTGLITVMIWR